MSEDLKQATDSRLLKSYRFDDAKLQHFLKINNKKPCIRY